jgi:DTW domain-containing protein YfiP
VLLNSLDALAKQERCARCTRPLHICICDKLPQEKLASPVEIVILQHPQESDVVLGTAPLVTAMVQRAETRVGLSWPSLEAALGRKVERDRWAVLFASKLTPELVQRLAKERVLLLDRHDQLRAPGAVALEGFIVLDGTWSQAKTLWWRNPWLLKLERIALQPREPSMYGKLRKEPRREWVSTLEAIADVLPVFDKSAEGTRTELRRLMRTSLQRVRDALEKPAPDTNV